MIPGDFIARENRARQEGHACATNPPSLTHGRHCPCTACAREDWTRADIAPCGMHGATCPNIYTPICPVCDGDGYTETWNDDQSGIVTTLCDACATSVRLWADAPEDGAA